MRKFSSLLLACMLFIPSLIAGAQDQPPPYAICLAGDYLTERQNLSYELATHLNQIDELPPSPNTAELYFTVHLNFLKALMAIDDVPECVAELHSATLERSLLYLQYYNLVVIGEYGNSPAHTAHAEELLEQINDINEDLSDQLVELGWWTIDATGQPQFTEWQPPRQIADLPPASASESSAVTAGFGKVDNPYPFGQVASTAGGFTLQVKGSLYGADRYVRQALNAAPPPQDQTGVVVRLEAVCEVRSVSCDVFVFDFSVVGDQGIFYEAAGTGFENELSFTLLAGFSQSGEVLFWVNKADTNLKLVYKNVLGDEPIFMQLLPPQDQGIELTTNQSINIRSGPDPDFERTAVFRPQETHRAFGRNGDGTWLRIAEGWVPTDFFEISDNVQNLPVVWE